MTVESMWDGDGILSFPIDCDAVLKHLKQDMRDDWVYDALLYQDLFGNKADLQQVIADLLAEGDGQYVGKMRHVYDIPKKGFGIRYSLETDFYDRFIYQSICTFLIGYFDPLLSHRVLGHRLNKRRKDERYLFKNRIELWKTFEGVTHTAFASNQALLATDLINYFENISIELIRQSFLSKLNIIAANGKEKLKIRNAIEILCVLLKRWGYSERHGLPQNRDASSFIANVVLSDVDHKMANLGYDYYRYVDDIRIICNDTRHARRALSTLIGELRTVGMNINTGKTDILTRDTDPQRLLDFFPATDDRSSAIENMWRSRSRRVISRSIPMIYDMINELIEKKETQSRQFRFAVNKIKILIECQLFDVASDLAESLIDLLIDSLETQAASTDQFCRILLTLDLSENALVKIENYLNDHVRSVHPWQNYHLWLLLSAKKRASENLIEIARYKLDLDIFALEVSAIFLYLKSVNKDDILESIVEKFDANWPYLHQRYFLFSTKDFDRDILRPVVEKLGIKIKGTARRAKGYFPEDGSLLCLDPGIDPFSIYDEISAYD